MQRTKKWLFIRVGILALVVVSNLATFGFQPTRAKEILPVVPLFLMVGIVPLMVLFLLYVGEVRKPTGVWTKPRWYDNPFNRQQPLYWLHFGAFFAMTDGLSMLSLSEPSNLSGPPLPASFFLVVGFGLWLGLRLSFFVFRRKFTEQQTILT